MRNARHHRQALLVVTDGADQNSHRSLEELIPIVQASQAQVFVIGFLGREEYDLYRKSRKQKIMLVTRKEVDNPLTAFNEMANESGAESFFPGSPDKLQEAVDAVAHQLRTQYTLAYYPKVKRGGFHQIEVRVAQSGARVRARHGFAGTPEQSAGCENEKLKPYPYESKVAAKNGCTVYQEDFQNIASGWPTKKGYHYKAGTYEIVNAKQHPDANFAFDYDRSSWGAAAAGTRTLQDTEGIPPGGVLVANGPLFTRDLNVSVTVEWKSGGAGGDMATVPGLVFRLNNRGYYAVLVSRDASESHDIAFQLVKKYHSESVPRDLFPWKDIPLSKRARQEKISVQCRGPVITIIFQEAPVAKFEDDEFKEGQVGMILYGLGRAVFSDLLAEEVCTSGQTPPPSGGTGQH